ncbi:hypothetical protein [Aliarcobacter butzleri]|uniref:hypothetical protein n=1 Tax=Aliarcobacter butzleri TaxID=28197 RepID=UPI002B248000|nr:hypothetical protein [Aliarcobacter butzleri]
MNWQQIAANTLLTMEKGKDEIKKESANYQSLFKKILTYPIKIIATFFLSPFLLIGVIFSSETTFFRKIIAFSGLIIATLASYFLVLLGFWAITNFVLNTLGWLSSIGFIVSFWFTSWVSILIQIAIFNFISTVTLKISQKQVLDYLKSLRDGKD